ncbi:phage tail sheath C-terminal domain-containing protein [Acinetobacter piscicola]|uniref:phage tail sheath C-terminal domain-containing protein n=1 Tax=Acinetobacter piscicola TaxID=2006115 RepID=UPI00355876AB
MTTRQIIAPLGHTIIALSAAPTIGAESLDWAQYLNDVSGAIEQRPAILVVPFSDIDQAQAFAEQAPVKTNYRIVAACYHGANDQEPEIAACIAAALADSNDPALPFNGVNLAGLTPVEDQFKLTFERMEAAMRKGVCMIQTGADGVPEIVRALSTYQANPTNGDPDDLVADINGALVLDYTRKVVRQAVRRNGRRKNTQRERDNLRSLILVELIKLDDAEILQNVRQRGKELTVLEDLTDRFRVNVKIPADWVRGMHVVAATLDVY